MLLGSDTVIKWLEQNGTPYWYIKTGASEKAHLIFSAQVGEETLSLEDGKARLKECLAMLGNGNYLIQAWTTLGQKKSWSTVPFQITSSTHATNNQPLGIGFNGVNNNPSVNVEELIQKALKDERTALKIETLEKENAAYKAKIKELEAEVDSAANRISGRFEQVMSMLDMGPSSKNNVPALNGNIADDGERIAATMETWATLDPEFEKALNGIVHLCKNDPTKYSMAKRML